MEFGKPVGDPHVIGFNLCRCSENRRREGRTFVVCVSREYIHTGTLRMCVSLNVKNALVQWYSVSAASQNTQFAALYLVARGFVQGSVTLLNVMYLYLCTCTRTSVRPPQYHSTMVIKLSPMLHNVSNLSAYLNN